MKGCAQKGFTTAELVITVVVIGIMAAIAVPKLTGPHEKIRCSEGVRILHEVLLSQKRYAYENSGNYAGSIGSLDVNFSSSANFDPPSAANNAAAVASIQRNNGTYTLSMSDAGAVACSGTSCQSCGNIVNNTPPVPPTPPIPPLPPVVPPTPPVIPPTPPTPPPPPPVPSASCGDGSCNGSETCSSCASDCGACPTPPPPPDPDPDPDPTPPPSTPPPSTPPPSTPPDTGVDPCGGCPSYPCASDCEGFPSPPVVTPPVVTPPVTPPACVPYPAEVHCGGNGLVSDDGCTQRVVANCPYGCVNDACCPSSGCENVSDN